LHGKGLFIFPEIGCASVPQGVPAINLFEVQWLRVFQ